MKGVKIIKHNNKSFNALILVSLFVCVVFCSVAFIAVEVNHNCNGDDCPICFQLHICGNNLQILPLILCGGFLCSMLRQNFSKILFSHDFRDKRSDLISLKVKLSN
ncbi:MAG: hypothetical protein IJM82_02060 [Synergistaceae bacterium]|nr:hypothetical protein [Synergistaceae bacterium]